MHVLLAIPDYLWVRMSIPDLMLALFFTGMLGIYAEFCAPGTIIPGVGGSFLALVSIAKLFAFSPDWRGAALLGLAPILFLLEAKYVTRGLLTVLGGAAMLAGSLMLFPGPAHRIHFATALAITAPFAAISSFLFSLAVRARRNKVAWESLS